MIINYYADSWKCLDVFPSSIQRQKLYFSPKLNHVFSFFICCTFRYKGYRCLIHPSTGRVYVSCHIDETILSFVNTVDLSSFKTHIVEYKLCLIEINLSWKCTKCWTKGINIRFVQAWFTSVKYSQLHQQVGMGNHKLWELFF